MYDPICARSSVRGGVCARLLPFTYSVFVLSGIASSTSYQAHVFLRLGLHLFHPTGVGRLEPTNLVSMSLGQAINDPMVFLPLVLELQSELRDLPFVPIPIQIEPASGILLGMTPRRPLVLELPFKPGRSSLEIAGCSLPLLCELGVMPGGDSCFLCLVGVDQALDRRRVKP